MLFFQNLNIRGNDARFGSQIDFTFSTIRVLRLVKNTPIFKHRTLQPQLLLLFKTEGHRSP